LAAAACAQPADGEARFYLGVDLGQTRMEQPDVIGFTPSQDDESFTWSFKLGYRFNRYFAVEGGYADFGEFHREPGACLAVFPSACFGSGYTTTSVDGFLLDAVGSWPVAEHLLLSGSAGVVYRTLDYHAPYSKCRAEFGLSRWHGMAVGHRFRSAHQRSSRDPPRLRALLGHGSRLRYLERQSPNRRQRRCDLGDRRPALAVLIRRAA
jgi:hypothetical protein